jgi:Domain of unknown function (DUF4252)
MKTKFYLLPIFLLPILLNGCFGINEEFSSIRDVIIMSFGNDYKSEYQFSVGSVGITVSSWIVDVSQDDELASDLLDDVSSVQVGVYKKLKNTVSPDFQILIDIEPDMLAAGWKSIIRSSKDDKLSAVYVRKNSTEILDRLFIINYDGDELVLVEVEGDLKEAVSTVIREKGMNIKI